ncbi:MAG TPA: hypothetical protein PLR41_10505 [Alphaproteobacteria bacterium]|nr:hypothetical protein [Alphaproteobacteria bacterium]
MRRLLVIPVCLALTACAQTTPQKPVGDPFAIAQQQALELGRVLAGIRLCEGVAWQTPFNEFMTAKRYQGLDEIQASMIAAMTGAGEAEAAPEMLECSPEGAARRAEALAELRPAW